MALHLIRRARLLAVTGLIAVSLAAPLAASAAEGGTISSRYSNNATVDVIGVSFQSKLLVNVRIAVVCDPYERWDGQTIVGGQIGASAAILQAQGRGVVGATGSASMTVVCDGSTVNEATVPVIASVAPFRRGDALAGAQAFVCEVPFGSCWADAASGPVEVKLR